MRFFSFFFFSLVLCYELASQPNGDKFFAKADSLFNVDKYLEAIQIYHLASRIYHSDKKWNKTQESILQIAYCTIFLDKPEATIDTLAVWIPIFEKANNSDSFLIAKSYLLKGLAYRNMDRFVESLQAFETAIILYQKLETNHSNFAYAYRMASVIYIRRLEYDKSIYYLKKALECDSTNTYAGSIYSQLANNYFYLKNYEKCMYYLALGLSVASKPTEIAILNSVGGSANIKLGNIVLGEKMISQALDVYSNDKRYWEDKVSCLVELAKAKKNHLGAEKLLLKAINEYSLFGPDKGRGKAKVLNLLGELYFKQGNIDSALSHYQQALIQVFPKFNSTNIADNPDIKDVYTESWIMTAAARKAEALMMRYHQKGNIADLHNAAYCFDLSLASVKMLHKSYGSENAKLYMGDYSHTYFEEAIEVNYLLYTLTGDQSKLQKIFALMEESKASVLSEAIQKNKALLLEGIPDSLLEIEQDLRITIADLITQVQNTGVEGQDQAAEAEKLRSQLSDTQLKYERLLEKMKEDYPQFRNYVEELPLPSFGDVTSRLLDEKSLFVEYFWGEKALYCLSIGHNGANIFKVERKAEFNDLIQQYLAFFKNSEAILNDPDCYLSTAHGLYQALFAKVLNAANAHATNILVVPDGLLGYLPFDALVTSYKGSTTSFGKVDFLIKKHGLHYGYSANVLLQQLENHREKGQLLRVMPRFAAGERGLSPLEYSDEETAGVRSWQSLDGPLATKASFLQMASQCRLIHLSTHAESNSGQGEPHIELADGQLMLPELYAMNLSAADLVVLSACETGLGKLEKGEGVMSLARGFAYAGANSLVASLWKVNERSTATLFAHFYQYLGEGKTKSEALRLAKLSTLENAESDTRQSPYYWAGFVFMGNDGEMDLPTGLPIGRIAVPLVVASLAGGIFYLRKRRRRLIA